MKISDLIDTKAAEEAGKRLAAIVRDIQMPALQRKPKLSFNSFFQTTKPKQLQEAAELSDSQIQSMAHRLDVLYDYLIKFEKQHLISVDTHQIHGAHPDDVLMYKLRKRSQEVMVRYVHLLGDNEKVNRYIKDIVKRINQIFDLGGLYI